MFTTLVVYSFLCAGLIRHVATQAILQAFVRIALGGLGLFAFCHIGHTEGLDNSVGSYNCNCMQHTNSERDCNEGEGEGNTERHRTTQTDTERERVRAIISGQKEREREAVDIDKYACACKL